MAPPEAPADDPDEDEDEDDPVDELEEQATMSSGTAATQANRRRRMNPPLNLWECERCASLAPDGLTCLHCITEIYPRGLVERPICVARPHHGPPKQNQCPLGQPARPDGDWLNDKSASTLPR